jgi:pimeloyl-ACP methyl ester carboxylesterase
MNRTAGSAALLGLACLWPCLAHADRPRPVKPVEQGVVEVPLDHRAPRAGTRKLRFERYRRSGTRPLVALHGGPGAPMPMGMILASPIGTVLLRHYDVVYFDQRGAGRSLLPAEKERRHVARHHARHTMAQHIGDIEVLRKKLFAGKKITVLGSSWGGFLGLGYALAHPDAVEALILGSCESTGFAFVQVCERVDHALQEAALGEPRFAAAWRRFRAATKRGQIVWRAGKPEAYRVQETDLISIADLFLAKARYKDLARALEAIVDGTDKGKALLDRLDLGPAFRADLGGSLPGTATFCQELVARDLLASVRRAAPALACDPRAYARAVLRTCRSFGTRRTVLNMEAALRKVAVPALLFAGRFDPLIPWQATARTAARLPNAGFVLVDGPHTPVKEGGTCLAEAIDAFARTGKPAAKTCPPPRPRTPK